MELVFLDIETTGLDFEKGDRIIEIAGLKLTCSGKILTFQELVNPQRSIPDSAKLIHHITDEMVKSALKIEEVIKKFEDFIKDSFLLGYNLEFDLSFLKNYFSPHFLKERILIDVLKITKFCFPNFKKYSLENVCRELNLPLPSHRALQDCWATVRVFFMCIEHLLRKGYKDFEALYKDFGIRI